MSTPTPNTQNLEFVNLIRHYVIAKGILTPEQGFDFIAEWLSGTNPFSNVDYLKVLINGMRAQSLGKLYLSNSFVDSVKFQRIWDSIPV